MRVPTMSHRLLAAVVVCSGCTQTGGPRWNANPGGVHTDVSIGDKPVRVVSGEPGASLAASVEPPDASDRTGARISGRVYDEEGRPAPGVRVRLAIAGEPGGKVRSTTTDRSGAFTLHELREGKDYTLIAEQRDADMILSGRARANAPRTGVRITLAPPGDDKASPIRPARPRVEPISRVEDESEPAADERAAGRETPANEEDLPPAAEASTDRSSQEGDGSVRASWSRRDALARRARQKRAQQAAEPVEPLLSPTTPHEKPALETDDEGPNPLPPALEVQEPQTSRAQPPVAERLAFRDRALERESNAQAVEPWPEEPRPIPDGVLPKRDHNITDSADTIVIADPPVAARPRPASRSPRPVKSQAPARSSDPATAPDPSTDSGGARESAAQPIGRPTWGEVMLARGEVPVDEGVARASLTTTPNPVNTAALARMAGSRPIDPRSGQLATPPATPAQPSRSLVERLFASARPTADNSATQTACRFDLSERRVLELKLPGLDGKTVSLENLSADMILLDFWGSWCEPCRSSIPHLVEIQTKLGPQYIQVVGVACEMGANPAERRATAARAARELGIKYPVLVTSRDGKCPVQKALQVQFYPTMILLDREGRILAREQGATETSLGRIDRAIAMRLRSHGALARADQKP